MQDMSMEIVLPLHLKMNHSSTSYLVVDLGNTDLKFAFYQNDLVHAGRGFEALIEALDVYDYQYVLVASVADEAVLTRLGTMIPKFILLSTDCNIPIQNGYSTPQTLGQDRLANAVALAHLSPDKPALSIDCGTCLKFDFVDKQGRYLGGSIAPGLRMRFKSLHEHTANLPLIESWSSEPLIGNNTDSSLVSGVVNGMRSEINETIARYLHDNENLTIYLTGGDASHFENAIKYPIFADSNLTLFGLKLILEANV